MQTGLGDGPAGRGPVRSLVGAVAVENGDRLIFLNSKEWLNKSVPILEGKVLVDTLHECENSSEKLL